MSTYQQFISKPVWRLRGSRYDPHQPSEQQVILHTSYEHQASNKSTDMLARRLPPRQPQMTARRLLMFLNGWKINFFFETIIKCCFLKRESLNLGPHHPATLLLQTYIWGINCRSSSGTLVHTNYSKLQHEELSSRGNSHGSGIQKAEFKGNHRIVTWKISSWSFNVLGIKIPSSQIS